MTGGSLRTLSIAAAALVASGCGGARLKVKAGAIAEVIEQAREAGAIKCAPVQLAMAESHHDFALQDLSEGNYYRAREELAVAELNANIAMERADCSGLPKTVTLKVTDGDADGDGIGNAVDDCPKRPEDLDGYADADGCPDPDNDEDGFADNVDECPNEAEDKDGFKDDDGCPDVDNDEDGLSDRLDQCPNRAEDDDGHEDDDGCPDCDNDGDGVPECPTPEDRCPDQAGPAASDGCPGQYKNVVVTKTRIELKQTVYFNTGKSRIKPISYGLLNEVAKAMGDHPKISVRIEGHTDSQGSEAFNLRLSQGRADAVRKYLIRQGVDGSRMVAKGYGEAVPIADNRTRGGREQNRRVEFVITSR